MNTIDGLIDSNGKWEKEEKEKMVIATEYFKEIFSSSNPDCIDEVLGCVNRCVTDDMNSILTKEFNSEEVHVAVKQIGSLKAPGPDGLPALFYQRFWSVVGPDVTTAVISVLNGEKMNPRWNQTQITLIPKIKKPCKMSDLRPISLCFPSSC